MLLINRIGLYEFVKKGDPAVMGLTKVGGENGVTVADLKRPRRKLPPSEAAEDVPITTA